MRVSRIFSGPNTGFLGKVRAAHGAQLASKSGLGALFFFKGRRRVGGKRDMEGCPMQAARATAAERHRRFGGKTLCN